MPPRRVLASERAPAPAPVRPVAVGPKVPAMVRVTSSYLGLTGVGSVFGAVVCVLQVFGGDGVPAALAGAVLFAALAVAAAIAATGLPLGSRRSWLTAAAIAVVELVAALADGVVTGAWSHLGPGIVLAVLVLWPSVVRHNWD